MIDIELKRDIVKELHDRNRLTVDRTPAVGCPGCMANRLHTPSEKAQYHPLSGHGSPDGKRYTYQRVEVISASDGKKCTYTRAEVLNAS